MNLRRRIERLEGTSDNEGQRYFFQTIGADRTASAITEAGCDERYCGLLPAHSVLFLTRYQATQPSTAAEAE